MASKRHVHVRGVKVPVLRRRIRKGFWGYAYKRARDDRRKCDRRIVLASHLRGHKRLATLVHEMLHQLNIGFAERTILRLEEGIVEMVEENPEVFRDLAP